jgi:hypothetical protein
VSGEPGGLVLEVVMELKQFVSETLKQIVEGVKKAQEKADIRNGVINPEGAFQPKDSMGDFAVGADSTHKCNT